ncbi:MAG: LysR family transcriptional regulator [Clostridium sp.]
MIDELRTFIAVVENNNFTKAGENINMSQPAVSKHIKNIEKHYGITLINRSYKEKHISITPCGMKLYSRAKDIVNMIRDLEYEMESFKEEVEGEIRIGASYTIGEFFMPKFLGEVSKIYPRVEFDIVIENTRTICKMVNSRQLDIGLVEGDFNKNDFAYKEFKEDVLVLAVPCGYVDTHKTFRKSDFENSVWISREEGSGTRCQLEDFLKVNDITPRKIIVFGSNYSVKEAVKHGLGVTLISELVVKNDKSSREVDIIKFSPKCKRKFNYILQRDENHSRLVNILIKMLNKTDIL